MPKIKETSEKINGMNASMSSKAGLKKKIRDTSINIIPAAKL